MLKVPITMAALLFASATAVYAADVPVFPVPTPPPPPPPAPAAFNWTGPYIGALAGYAWGEKEWDSFGGAPVAHGVAGWLAGLEAGYRFQSGAFVFGVEGDWAWTNATGMSSCAFGAYDCRTDINWLGTLTGQVGFAAGRFLIYAEAGAAVANEDFTATGPTTYEGGLTNWGWLVGVGAAVGLADNLYLKAEYNYMNFGTDTVDPFTDGIGNAPFDLTQTIHRATVGIGFRF